MFIKKCSCCGKILGDAFVAERLDAPNKFCSLICFRRCYRNELLASDETERAKMVG